MIEVAQNDLPRFQPLTGVYEPSGIHLTSLEFANYEWTIYHYDEKEFAGASVIPLNKKIPALSVVTDEIGLFINSLQ